MRLERNETNNRLQTSCQECVFAVYEEDTQTGCEFGRTEKSQTIEAYNEKGKFFVIDGICNLMRKKDWNDGIIDKDKLMSEVSLSFLIIVDAFALNSMDLKKFNITYDGRYEVVIVGPPSKEKELLSLRKKIECKAILTPYSDYTKHKAMVNKQYSYSVIVDNNKSVNINLSNFDNNYKLEQTKPILTKFDNTTYVSCLAYNYVSFGSGIISYEKNMEALEQYAKNHS